MSEVSRRRWPRFEIETRALVLVQSEEDGQMFAFVTQNISEGGMLVAGDRPSYPFTTNRTRVNVALDVREADDQLAAEEDITFSAVVVRQHGPSSFGLEVDDISDVNRERLREFLQRRATALP